LAGVGARKAFKKFRTRYLFISPTAEASNFKFGTRLGFGT